MSIEEAFLTHIEGQAGIVAIFGDEIYSNHLPETPTFPALAVALKNADHLHHLGGSAGIVLAEFEVKLWTEDVRDTVEAGEVVRLAVQGYRGPMGTLTALSSTLGGEENTTVMPDDGTSAHTYAKSLTFRVKFREEIPSF